MGLNLGNSRGDNIDVRLGECLEVADPTGYATTFNGERGNYCVEEGFVVVEGLSHVE